MRRRHRARGRAALLSLLILAVRAAWAGDPPQKQKRPDDLTQISLEELANIEVTTVAKKGQKLSQVAAAVYVITQEDIRRSGMTTIPELLRMVPGMDVARISGTEWAISARGFNDLWANKLLVLIDGRTVYTPLFGGVDWDMQDLLLEDIERIEVIRGPGATIWGANAVNGVINVITKRAKDTQGGLATAGGGSEERGFGAATEGGWGAAGITERISSTSTGGRFGGRAAWGRRTIGTRRGAAFALIGICPRGTV